MASISQMCERASNKNLYLLNMFLYVIFVQQLKITLRVCCLHIYGWHNDLALTAMSSVERTLFNIFNLTFFQRTNTQNRLLFTHMLKHLLHHLYTHTHTKNGQHSHTITLVLSFLLNWRRMHVCVCVCVAFFDECVCVVVWFWTVCLFVCLCMCRHHPYANELCDSQGSLTHIFS